MAENNLTVIDHSTGEVTPFIPAEEAIEANPQLMNLLSEMRVAEEGWLIQDYILATMIPVEEQANVYDLYDQVPLEFTDVINRVLPVYGACLYEFEEGLKVDGSSYPRYFQARILVMLDGELRIVKSSGQNLLRHVAFMCRGQGRWFVFDTPIEYRFCLSKSAGKAHIIDKVHKEIKHIVPKSQRKEEK
jgi:hypothetical protein